MSRTPGTVSVEVAWTDIVEGSFELNTSQLNGTDTLGGDFGGNVFDEITRDVKSVQITRGHGGDLSVIEQGRCVLELADSTGKYNPDNAGAIVNLFTNPSLEINATGWSASSGASSITRTAASAYSGSYVGRCVFGNATDWIGCPFTVSVTGSTTYTASAYVKGTAGNRISLRFYSNDGGEVIGASAENVTLTGAWQRITNTATTGPSANNGGLLLRSSFTGAQTLDVDAVQFERASSATSYIDGDQDNGRWAGTPHASQSYRGGPLYNYLDTHKPLRVRMNHLNTNYGLFRGFISKIEHDPAKSAQSSRIEAVDFFEWLNAAKPVIAATGPTTVGAVIGMLLDSLGFNDPSLRNLDVGRNIPNFSADGSASALSLIENLLKIDLGIVFVDANGVVMFIEGDSRWANLPPVDTFDDSVISLARPGIDKQDMINRQTVIREGGSPQTYVAQDKPTWHPFYDGEVIQSPYLNSDSQALSLAAMIVSFRKRGRPPTRGLVLWDRDDQVIHKQVLREVGDLVQIDESLGGTNLTGSIAGLIHELAPGGLHKSTYLITKRPFLGFTLDVSVLDGPDVLTY